LGKHPYQKHFEKHFQLYPQGCRSVFPEQKNQLLLIYLSNPVSTLKYLDTILEIEFLYFVEFVGCWTSLFYQKHPMKTMFVKTLLSTQEYRQKPHPY